MNNDYKTRFIKEYNDLEERYYKLYKILIKMKAGTLDFKPTCSYKLLKNQSDIMRKYLEILDIRAELEHIFEDEK